LIKLLRQFSIRQRLWLIVALGILISLIVSALSLNYTEQLFIESEKYSTQVQVKIAKKMVAHFYEKSINGELSRQEAKQEALDFLERVALDQRNYFYVYSGNNFLVMHPFLKNQTFPDEPASAIIDSVKHFRKSIDQVADKLNLPGSGLGSVDLIKLKHPNSLEGYFNYLLYIGQDGDALVADINDPSIPSSAQAKLGYGTYFEPWDWVIFGGVYLDDLEILKQDLTATLMWPTIAAILMILILMILISMSITRPLFETIEQIERISDTRSYKDSLFDTPSDEVGALAHSFNKMLARMRAHAQSEKLLQEKLRQSQKLEAVGQLTGGVAHDFNNLLTIIRGNLELAQTEIAQPLQNDLISEAIKASDRGALLTQRLLAYSRTQSLNPQPIAINELIEDTKFLMERTIGENISISLQKEPEIWICSIDPSQMENALLNLAINARDAMPNGGEITICTSNVTLTSNEIDQDLSPGDYVSISLTDTGSGISKDHIDKVFEPFFSTKDPSEGSGLGLSMVFGFVSQSNGHVEINSRLEHGTTVSMLLPRATGNPNSASIVEETEVLSGNGELILVVEDERALLDLDLQMLKILNYRVVGATTTEEALSLFKKEQDIELVFTDIMLSETRTGIELAKMLKKIRPDTKVVFTSGYSDDSIRIEANIKLGVNLLQKPFTHIGLSHFLRRSLKS